LDIDLGGRVGFESLHPAGVQLTDLIGHHAIHRLGLEDPRSVPWLRIICMERT
jgi:hypothetical protein